MRLQSIAGEIDELQQFLVRGTRVSEMITLDRVLLNDLPIGGHRHIDLLDEREAIQIGNEATDLGLRSRRHDFYWCRRRVKIDEDEGREHGYLHRLQAMRPLVESRNILA